MKYKCWIVHNGNLKNEFMNRFVNWLKESANDLKVETQLIKNTQLLIEIKNGNSNILENFGFEKPDFIIFWDKDVYLARHLESLGLKVYNSSFSIEYCDDKMKTYQRLSNKGIKMPKTIFSPMVYFGLKIFDYSYLDIVSEEIGFPMVVKETYGSGGRQVYLIKNKVELLDKVKELSGVPHLYQEFIKSSFGKDVRMYVIGNKVVASMSRFSENDFRANTDLGGKMGIYEPTEEEKELALKISKELDLFYCGVDFLFSEEGELLLCEVNSNATMIDFSDLIGVNLGKLLIKNIIDDCKK